MNISEVALDVSLFSWIYIMGTFERYLDLFKSYLNERSQSLRINSIESASNAVEFGIMQKTLFIKKIAFIVKKWKISPSVFS